MLEFDLTAGDFAAYNIYGVTAAPAAKSRSARSRLWGSVVILATLTIVIALEGSWVEGLTFGLVAAAAFWLLWPRFWVWLATSQVHRLTRAGGLGTPGPCRLWIDGEGLHDATPTGASSVTWNGIDRIEENDTHVFIFTGAIHAYVIPKRIGEPAVRDFVNSVRAGMPR